MQAKKSKIFADSYGREITYLRVSITDRCNFRCEYCMPAEGLSHLPRPELLSYEELEQVIRVFAEHGVRKVRLTGGEPLVRADVPGLVSRIAAIDGIEGVAMTTNAFLLGRHAKDLKTAGLDELNISLDSLKRERFEKITRGSHYDRVLEGIDAARAAGFEKIKLNAVVIRGFNDDELVDLVRYAANHGAIMRFIEFMPIGHNTIWGPHATFPAIEIRERLAAKWDVKLEKGRYGAGPARYWRVRGEGLPEEGTPVGFISAVTECFCADCNRVRITPQGGMRACLADEREVNLRDALRDGRERELQIEELKRLVALGLLGKKEAHSFDMEGDAVTLTTMNAIGG